MANKAAQELQAITQEVVEVEDAAVALAKLKGDDEVEQAPDGEAKFPAAEAIATGVLASLVLGPIGGLLVAGAGGWLKKQGDQKILDKISAEQNVLNSAGDIYADQLSSFIGTAANANDREQIGAMQTTLDVAREFITSADAGLRDQGAQMMQGLDADMNGYARNQEEDRIAVEAAVKADKRQLGIDGYNRYKPMQDDFDAQSAPWLARKEAANIALSALQGGTAAQIHAAMIMFNKTLDPNSAVLGEERNAITDMGSLLDTAYNFFGEKFTGQKMNAEQRRELGAAILDIQDQSTQFQLAREGRFAERAADDLPAEYIDRFTLVDNTPGAEPLNIPDDFKQVIEETPSLLGEGAERLGQEIVKQADKHTAEFKRDMGAIGDFLSNAGAVVGETIEEGVEAFRRDVRRGLPGTRRTN